MKQLYSIIPAFLFSAGITVFIAGQSKMNIASEQASFEKNIDAVKTGGDMPEFAEYEFQRLRDPETGRIPSGIRSKELEYAATLPGYVSPLSKGVHDLSSLVWKSRGPANVGARTRAFAVDVSNGSKFLAGSTSGGMWTSSNGGTSWSQTWGVPHQSVTCISQDKRAGKTNTWYIGTGEGYGQSAGGSGAYYLGNGMYKSTDGGQTWNVVTSTSSGTPQTFDNVWDIMWNVATNPADLTNEVVYTAIYGAIMKRTHGGTSWTIAKGSTSASPFAYFTDVAVSPTGKIYATLSSDGSQK